MITESPTLNEQSRAVSASLSANHRLMTRRLTHESQSEVLRFLAERPLHTAVMSGFIRDNGLESELNRGRFYGYRNKAGTLEGVSLIGHATFIEARSDSAMLGFARLARASTLVERERDLSGHRALSAARDRRRDCCAAEGQRSCGRAACGER